MSVPMDVLSSNKAENTTKGQEEIEEELKVRPKISLSSRHQQTKVIETKEGETTDYSTDNNDLTSIYRYA